MEVVGESFYQEALTALCGGYNRHGHEFECDAVIALEPTNPYDSNAVKVAISGRQVGHLSRDQAARVGAAMRELHLTAVACRAQINGGWRTNQYDEGYFGVRLAIPNWGAIDFGSGGVSPQDPPRPTQPRSKVERPKANPSGPLVGHKAAIMGQSGNGDLALKLANAGVRLVAGVGQTTTLLVVCEPKPFTFGIERSAAYRKAEELMAAGHSIQILWEAEVLQLIDASAQSVAATGTDSAQA